MLILIEIQPWSTTPGYTEYLYFSDREDAQVIEHKFSSFEEANAAIKQALAEGAIIC